LKITQIMKAESIKARRKHEMTVEPSSWLPYFLTLEARELENS
jgi:hypothetical protein